MRSEDLGSNNFALKDVSCINFSICRICLLFDGMMDKNEFSVPD